ncbi:hypothetical protein LG295_13760 (plasmid) [Staphylococcus pseudoxylosus]|uniref:RNA polymerase factor sigma-54 n=1 Tax=Staphylococcus TaxID=1279 RepID=UPI00384A5F3B
MSNEQILNHEMQLSNYQLQSLKMLSYKQEDIIQYLYRVEDNYPYIQYKFNNSENTMSMDNYKSSETNIREDLIDQLFDYNLTNKYFHIAKFIILNLDNKGFFDIDKKSFCNQQNITFIEFQSIKKIIQNLSPIGCGSENTFDFISFQLQEKKLWDNTLFGLFRNHLEDIANANFNFLENYDVSHESFVNYLSYIKDQDIFPYLESNAPQNIIPEAYITIKNKEFTIKMNDHYINALSLDESAPVHDKIYKQNESKFNFLKTILSKRTETLYKIINMIITVQYEGILNNNQLKYRPLTQNMVAENINMHPSTISRGIHSRYIQINHTLYKLSDLFVQPYNSTISTHHIKHKIKYLIKNEPFRNPFSDDTLVSYLKGEDIFISRRTVAKYRKELQIKNCNQRRAIYKEKDAKK